MSTHYPFDADQFQALPVAEQLERAARDLWSTVHEVGVNHVVFMDRRRLATRVECLANGLYRVSWQAENGTWQCFEQQFANPREAAFHAYQGPH